MIWENNKPGVNHTCINRSFSEMAATNSNRSILKTYMYTTTRKNTFALLSKGLPSFSILGLISAEKMRAEN